MEFADKKVAKGVAAMLNGQQIGVLSAVCTALRAFPSATLASWRLMAAATTAHAGGKRRSAFYYDLWNIKYLSKFKWEHLTEELGTHTRIHARPSLVILTPRCFRSRTAQRTRRR